jgi:hypothetical protein
VRAVVLTVDQRGSTRAEATDRVPEALDALADLDVLRPFERTAGDELQGVLSDPDAVAAAVERLLRAGSWNVGLGLGAVDEPLPQSTRAARGPAFALAREAVTGAKSALWRLRVAADRDEDGHHLETALWLWAALLARRTDGGWEVADLVDTGLRYDAVARELGISQSAVSQRAAAAGIVEGRRARALVASMVGALLQDEGP